MPRTILVVDDSPTIVKFVSFSLKNTGYTVITASDGMEAIETLAKRGEPVDLVITDLNMPNLDGYSLISALRQNERMADLPIIILSSEDKADDRERGMKLGANAYLVKPFKSSILLDEVSKFVA